MAAGTTTQEQGFTLIEVIAVLVILGLLAAVAIPKYQDLQDAARLKALDSALAAALSHVTIAYSKELLRVDGASNSIQWDTITGSCANISGNFTITCAEAGSSILITASDGYRTSTANWNIP